MAVTSTDLMRVVSNKPISLLQYSRVVHRITSDNFFFDKFMTTVPSDGQCGHTHLVPILNNTSHLNVVTIIIPKMKLRNILINDEQLTGQANNVQSFTTTYSAWSDRPTKDSFVAVHLKLASTGLYNISHSDPDVNMCVSTYGHTIDIQLSGHILRSRQSNIPPLHITHNDTPLPKSPSSGYSVLPLVSAHQESHVINKAAISDTSWTAGGQEPNLGEGFNATVIAVIVSLASAVFFVIACIAGFVVAEFACTGQTIFSGAKVTPLVLPDLPSED